MATQQTEGKLTSGDLTIEMPPLATFEPYKQNQIAWQKFDSLNMNTYLNQSIVPSGNEYIHIYTYIYIPYIYALTIAHKLYIYMYICIYVWGHLHFWATRDYWADMDFQVPWQKRWQKTPHYWRVSFYVYRIPFLFRIFRLVETKRNKTQLAKRHFCWLWSLSPSPPFVLVAAAMGLKTNDAILVAADPKS